MAARAEEGSDLSMAARAEVSSIAAAAAVLVLAVMAGGAAAKSTSGCTQTLIGMSPCLNYITGNETAPSKSCCSQLATVAASRPDCLCAALNVDTASLGLGDANRTRALGLPEDCAVKTPPISNCNSTAALPASLLGATAQSKVAPAKTSPPPTRPAFRAKLDNRSYSPTSSGTGSTYIHGASLRGPAAGGLLAGVVAAAASIL